MVHHRRQVRRTCHDGFVALRDLPAAWQVRQAADKYSRIAQRL
jgi:hypothetical protein